METRSLQNERCWICLSDLGQSKKKEWVYPCKCSLISHEECLLYWISESEKRNRNGIVRCPQCNKPYKVIQWKSQAFKVLRHMYSIADKAVPVALAGIGSTAVIVACTAYGAYTVLTVYGPVEGQKILGSAGRWEHGRWIWLPMIPLILVWSRFQAGSEYMPLSALLMLSSDSFRLRWPLAPPLSLTFIPAVSSIYRYIWGMTLGRLERHWEKKLPAEQRALTVQRIDLTANRPADDAQQNAPVQREDGALANNAQFQTAIVLNEIAFGRTLAESLLLPIISAFCGRMICKIPRLKAYGLDYFHRSLVGGCAYFVVKDLLRVLYKYLFYRTRVSRTIDGRKRL